MKLLTKEVKKALPPLYSQEHTADPLVTVKFFDPTGSFTWYAYEGSFVNENGVQCAEGEQSVDFLCFGLVDGLEKETGYFSLNELQSVRVRYGLGIERDLHWKPVPVSTLKK